jgi:hypothetical protein
LTGGSHLEPAGRRTGAAMNFLIERFILAVELQYWMPMVGGAFTAYLGCLWISVEFRY